MRYAVIIEKGEASFGAYVPDLPGCVAVGNSEEEVRKLISEAMEFHLEGMLENGESIPEANSSVDYFEVKGSVSGGHQYDARRRRASRDAVAQVRESGGPVAPANGDDK
jgi:predicted RNase H-like HicB family nuclease